jgi:hypothetical protein
MSVQKLNAQKAARAPKDPLGNMLFVSLTAPEQKKLKEILNRLELENGNDVKQIRVLLHIPDDDGNV